MAVTGETEATPQGVAARALMSRARAGNGATTAARKAMSPSGGAAPGCEDASAAALAIETVNVVRVTWPTTPSVRGTVGPAMKA